MYTLIYVLILFTSAVNGAGASILWVAQGKYISECANEDNKGMFNSIFWIFNLGSMVTGNLMAAYVLGSFSE